MISSLQYLCIATLLYKSNASPVKELQLTDGFWHPSSVDAVVRGEHEYEETINNYNYKVIYGGGQKLTWIKAFQKCKSVGYNLVDIENHDELAIIRDFIIRSKSLLKSLPEGAAGNSRDGPGFWTAGSDTYREGYYVWMSSGYNVDSDLWNEILREPSNNGGNEHCIQLNYRGSAFIMNDVPCSDKLNYICKRVADPAPVPNENSNNRNNEKQKSLLSYEMGLLTHKIA